MARAIPKEIITQIPILYKELGSQKKVAEKLGISASTVGKYLKQLEDKTELLNIEKKRLKTIEYSQEIIDKINEEYQNCLNMAEVSRRLNIPYGHIKKFLTEESLKLNEQQFDDRDALYFYIYKLFGEYKPEEPVSNWNLTQMSQFKSKGMPYRGQLLTLKYFFEIKKNPITKAKGSIGIIPYCFEQARQYYASIADKQNEINEAIKKQLEQDRIEIKINPSDYIGKKKKKKMIDLSQLERDVNGSS